MAAEWTLDKKTWAQLGTLGGQLGTLGVTWWSHGRHLASLGRHLGVTLERDAYAWGVGGAVFDLVLAR